MITIYFIRPNKKMFVSNINESAFPKIFIDHAMNALLSAISDILQSRLLLSPQFPKLHSAMQNKGGWAVALALVKHISLGN